MLSICEGDVIMGDELYGNILYTFSKDQSIVSNENGDLFVRSAWGDYYTTAAGTKGDWLLRKYGDDIVVRDSDGIAYARFGDQDWFISSLPRINPISSTSVIAPVYTVSPASEQSIIGVANLSGAAWYNQKWHEVANQHPDWPKQQVYDEMTRSIQEAEWNANWEILKNEIANSRSPEERDRKIREHRPELEKYKASGIDIGNYSYSGIEHQYSVPPTSFVDTELTEVDGISKDKYNDYQAQKEHDQNIVYNSLQQESESFTQHVENYFEKVKKNVERLQKKRQERDQPVGDFMDALMVTPAGPLVEGVNIVKGLGTFIKGASEAEKLAKISRSWGKLSDGTNQGIKHFVDYWELYSERIPSIAQRLGIDPVKFAKTVEGFENFTNEALRITRTEGVQIRQSGDKTLYFMNGAENAKKGVVVIMKDGRLQSMMPSELRSFLKME